MLTLLFDASFWYDLIVAVVVVALIVLFIKVKESRIVIGIIALVLVAASGVYCGVSINTYLSAEGGIYGVISDFLGVAGRVEINGKEMSFSGISLTQEDGDVYSTTISNSQALELEEGEIYGVNVNGLPCYYVEGSTDHVTAFYKYTFYGKENNEIKTDTLKMYFQFVPNKTTLYMKTEGGSEAVKLWYDYFTLYNFKVEVMTVKNNQTELEVGEGDMSNYSVVTYYLDDELYTKQVYIKNSNLNLPALPTVENKQVTEWLDSQDNIVTEKTVNDNLSIYAYSYEPLDYELNENVIVNYTGTDAILHIPSSYSLYHNKKVAGSDFKITTIGERAFSSNIYLRDVYVPDSIEEMCPYSFAYCGFEYLRLNVTSNLKTIGSNAFDGCSNLKRITIPEKVESIGRQAFSRCEKLQEVQLESSTIYNVVNQDTCGLLVVNAEKVLVKNSVDNKKNSFLNDTSIFSYSTIELNNLPESSGVYSVYTRDLTGNETFTVTYYFKDDINSDENWKIIGTQFYKSSEEITLLDMDNRNGWQFTGWTDENGLKVESGKTITSNLKVYGGYKNVGGSSPVNPL